MYDQPARIQRMDGLFGGDAEETDRRDPGGLRAPGAMERPGGLDTVHFLPTLTVQQSDSGRDSSERDRDSSRNWLRPADLLGEEEDETEDERFADGPEREGERGRAEEAPPLDWQDLREQLAREAVREETPDRSTTGSETSLREDTAGGRGTSPAGTAGQPSGGDLPLRVDPVGRSAAPAAPGAPVGTGAERQTALAPAMRMAAVGAVGAPVSDDDLPRAEPRLTGTREAFADVSRRWESVGRPPPERGFTAAPPPVSAPPPPSLPSVMPAPADRPPSVPRPGPATVQPLDIRRFGEEDNRSRPRNEFRNSL